MLLKLLVIFSAILAVIKVVKADQYQKCTTFDCSGKEACVTIYQERNWVGWFQCIPLYSSECTNLNAWWVASGPRVSGADSHNTCVRLYDKQDCGGNYIEVKPDGRNYGNLNTIGFEDVTRSVSSCRRKTTATNRDKEVYKKCTTNDCSGKSGCVTIYQHRYYAGWYQCLTFRNTECTNLNPWWLKSGPRVSGADSHKTCIRLYEGANCEGNALRIEPGVKHLDDLRYLGFEDIARSVSSCSRPLVNSNLQCHVKIVFSRAIDSNEISTLASHVLGKVDEVAGLVASTISIKIPGVYQMYAAIKLLAKIFESEQKVAEALIDAKIEQAFARNTASQMSSRIKAIDNRLSTVLQQGVPEVDKRIALTTAIHTCEQVSALFADGIFSFSRNKLVSSPYLVAFSVVYLSVAKLAYKMREDMRPKLVTEIRALAELNKVYMYEALKERTNKVSRGSLARIMVIEDAIVCKPNEIEGHVSYYTQCYSYGFCANRDECTKCLDVVKKSIDTEIKQFFQPIISKLERFPN